MFSPQENPSGFMFRAYEYAVASGHEVEAELLIAFSNEWAATESAWSAQPPLSWRLAKVTPTGRAALSLALKYVDIKDGK